MRASWRLAGALAALVAARWAGLALFAGGFFLTRVELNEFSRCDQLPGDAPRRVAPASAESRWPDGGGDGCWAPAAFARAFIIVIDALRFDFMAPPAANLSADDSAGAGSLCRGQLSVVGEVLERRPRHAALFRFTADPPTTTMQRLKGLTTGGLPTFIDFSDNFSSEDIREDNWLEQLRRAGRRAVHMGDDMWTTLYPRSFHRAFPVPAFNVKDLDSVDAGVRAHLLPELAAADWSVLIAHFTGVDHAGHTFFADHPATRRKLRETDATVREALAAVEASPRAAETVVLIFGDHGMSDEGDHGGGSPEETGSGLFVYSPARPLLLHPQRRDDGFPEVQQVDLVPSLALLLGLPVPFSSVGALIAPLFEAAWSRAQVAEALRANALQVLHYLARYADAARTFLAADLAALRADAARADALLAAGDADAAAARYREVLGRAGALCRAKWTAFNLGWMAAGLALLAAALLAQAELARRALGGLGARALPAAAAAAAVAGYTQGLFTNSYIVAESRVVLFLAQTVAAAALLARALRGGAGERGGLWPLAGALALARLTGEGDAVSPSKSPFARLVAEGLAAPPHALALAGLVLAALALLPRALAALDATRDADAAAAVRVAAAPQLALVAAYWVAAPLLPVRTANMLARAVFAGGGAALVWLLLLRRRRGGGAGAVSRPLAVVAAATPSLLLLEGAAFAPVWLSALWAAEAVARELLSHGDVAAASVWAWLFAQRLFFASGHTQNLSVQATTAAFVGFEDFSLARAVALVVANTFGPSLLLLLAALAALPAQQPRPFVAAQLAANTLSALRLAATAANVAVQRRHLMVWAIFAPKFVFDAVSALFADALALAALLACAPRPRTA